MDVKSSFGKDNIINKLVDYSTRYINIYIVVDGAAFGNQIQGLFSKIKSLPSNNIIIFAPESFEFLILNTDKFSSLCKDELANTSNFIDPSRYKTWENYFESLLSFLSKKYFKVKYEKTTWDNLHPIFRSDNLVYDIVNQLEDLSKDIIIGSIK